jgi:hypothetical protein
MLSQPLIAYSYEFDAALASALGKRGSGDVPSLAMCANALQFVGSEVVRAFHLAKETVERQWEAQWGTDLVAALRNALDAACARLPQDFPQYPMTAAHRGAFPRGE